MEVGRDMMHGCQEGEGLLEWLTQEVGCAYLSDLKTEGCRAALRRALREAPAGRWPLKEWQDACQYLGACAGADSEASARDCLDRVLDW